VQGLYVVCNSQLPFLLDEVDRLTRDEYFEGHVLTGEERDKVHEYLEHFGPILLLFAIIVL